MIFEIKIESLEIECIIGIEDFERENPQKVVVDLKLSYRYNGIFLNYCSLRDDLISLFKDREFGLLEDAIIEIIETLKKKYTTIEDGSIEISKPDIFEDCVVSLKSSF